MPAAKPQILTLSFQRPFKFRQVTDFLKPRAIPGVEVVRRDLYCRSIELGGASGLLVLTCTENEPCVRLEIDFPDQDKLPAIAVIAKQIFDLDAPVKTIDDHLKKDGNPVLECLKIFFRNRWLISEQKQHLKMFDIRTRLSEK